MNNAVDFFFIRITYAGVHIYAHVCSPSGVRGVHYPKIDMNLILMCVSVQSLSTIGIMSRNLRVQATEDVYQTTREKMSIAEEESKKVR
jgi:hypothetical protein